MNKILLLILISFSILKDSILIGDSRIAEIASVLFELEDSYYSYRYSPFYSPITQSPVAYEDFSIQVSTVEKVEHIYLDTTPNEVVHNHLRDAKPGTNVLINLGLKSLDSLEDIIIFSGKLADKYYKLNFYFVSIIGVDETKCSISNSSIREFNKLMENRLIDLEFANFKYKNILSEGDPTQIILDGKPFDILKFTTDGMGFYRNGLTRIFNSMVEGLEFES